MWSRKRGRAVCSIIGCHVSSGRGQVLQKLYMLCVRRGLLDKYSEFDTTLL